MVINIKNPSSMSEWERRVHVKPPKKAPSRELCRLLETATESTSSIDSINTVCELGREAKKEGYKELGEIFTKGCDEHIRYQMWARIYGNVWCKQ